MNFVYSQSSLKHFFMEMYNILKDTDPKVLEIWYEISEIKFFKKFDNSELREFLYNFNCVSIQKGNYINYLVINKISFIIECFKFIDSDIQKLSDLLEYDGFEALIKNILLENNYNALNNFRFSDKSDFKSKTKQIRYEIDVIGLYRNKVLIIDAKRWKRKDSYSSINKAATLQLQRVIALKRNPEILSRLITKLSKKSDNLPKMLPFFLLPIMVTLEDNSIKISEKGVPLVSIYQFNSFLQELRMNISHFTTIKFNKLFIQTQLF